MRFTIPDLMADQQQIAKSMKRIFAQVNAHIAEAENAPQPDDLFDGLGDFEYHPTACALMQERQQSLMLARRLVIAEVGLTNVEAILDRPLSKLGKKDLLALIRTAQDALAGESGGISI